MKKISLILTLFAISNCLSMGQVPLATEDVILQGYAWNSHKETSWSNLYKQAEEIASSFDLIWLPPASVAEGGSSQNMGYHPLQYSALNSAWGSGQQLRYLLKTFKEKGCKPIAEVVINHKSGMDKCGKFPKEYFGKFGTFEMPNSFICNDDECIKFGCYPGGNADTGQSYLYSRDLDHSNPALQEVIVAYLSWLTQEIGFSGYCYEMALGFDPMYLKLYNNTTLPDISIAEYTANSYDTIRNSVVGTGKTSLALDFLMKNAINRWDGGTNYYELAAMDGHVRRPAGLVNSEEMRQYAVTFIDYDMTSYPAPKNDRFPQYKGNIQQANAFLLSAPGIPCVFWKHWNSSNKAAIQQMIAARKAVGLNSNSDVRVTNTDGYYECISEGTKGKLICRIGSFSSVDIPEGFTEYCSGKGWAYYSTVPKKPDTPTDIQEIQECPIVYAQNGTIYASVPNFEIYNLVGQNVSAYNGQVSGIYIVKVGEQTFKVHVK